MPRKQKATAVVLASEPVRDNVTPSPMQVRREALLASASAVTLHREARGEATESYRAAVRVMRWNAFDFVMASEDAEAALADIFDIVCNAEGVKETSRGKMRQRLRLAIMYANTDAMREANRDKADPLSVAARREAIAEKEREAEMAKAERLAQARFLAGTAHERAAEARGVSLTEQVAGYAALDADATDAFNAALSALAFERDAEARIVAMFPEEMTAVDAAAVLRRIAARLEAQAAE